MKGGTGMEAVIIEMKRKLTYRAEGVFTILSSLTSILVQMALWRYLYRENPGMLEYMVGYVIYSSILRILYSNQMYHLLAEKILNGDFILDLLKPVNLLWFSYLKSLGDVLSSLLLQALPLLILFAPVLGTVTKWEYLAAALLALLAGHVLISMIYAIVGLMAFLFVEVWALRRLTEDTIRLFSGALLPIALFPEPLKKAAEFLPFHYLYDFPLQILLSESTDWLYVKQQFIGVLVWGLGLSLLLYVSYRLAIRFCVVQGG